MRLLYFMNTIDSFFLVSGLLAYFFIRGFPSDTVGFFLRLILTFTCFKIADFHPWFAAFTPLYVLFFYNLGALEPGLALQFFMANLVIFTVIQFLFMGIPNSIVGRDISIPLRMLWNSIWTIAATTISLPVSVYFATFLSFNLYAAPIPISASGMSFWGALFLCAFFVRLVKADTFVSDELRPVQPINEPVGRVIILNIDGVRLDRFYEAKLPFLSALEKEATYFPRGLLTVYRALTNPAFASILTSTLPQAHGVKDNSIKHRIKTEALPDLINTILYGSMHVRHFSKPHWKTKVVSLPVHSAYKSDDIMFEWLKDDLMRGTGTRLFIADISEADFLGHAYGSESGRYLAALKRTDRRIADFFAFLKDTGLMHETVVIVCSDHGIKNIDHSYLLFKAEKYVPFLMTGKNIKKNNPLYFQASIMDIGLTVAYLLGAAYPKQAHGRVFVEALRIE